MHWRGGLGLARPFAGLDVKFCTSACHRAWEAELSFSKVEIEAIEALLPIMGKYVADNGLGSKAFNDFTRDEILGLFARTVTTFRMKVAEAIDVGDIPF